MTRSRKRCTRAAQHPALQNSRFLSNNEFECAGRSARSRRQAGLRAGCSPWDFRAAGIVPAPQLHVPAASGAQSRPAQEPSNVFPETDDSNLSASFQRDRTAAPGRREAAESAGGRRRRRCRQPAVARPILLGTLCSCKLCARLIATVQTMCAESPCSTSEPASALTTPQDQSPVMAPPTSAPPAASDSLTEFSRQLTADRSADRWLEEQEFQGTSLPGTSVPGVPCLG